MGGGQIRGTSAELSSTSFLPQPQPTLQDSPGKNYILGERRSYLTHCSTCAAPMRWDFTSAKSCHFVNETEPALRLGGEKTRRGAKGLDSQPKTDAVKGYQTRTSDEMRGRRTASIEACKNDRASSETQTFSMDRSPCLTFCRMEVVLWAPSSRRMGRALGTNHRVSWTNRSKSKRYGRDDHLLNRSRFGSRLRPMPSSRRILMTILTKSPSIRT